MINCALSMVLVRKIMGILRFKGFVIPLLLIVEEEAAVAHRVVVEELTSMKVVVVVCPVPLRPVVMEIRVVH